MKSIEVHLGSRRYPIYYGHSVLPKYGKMISESGNGQFAIVTNPEINKLFGSELLGSLKKQGVTAEIIEIPAGEHYKTLVTVSNIIDRLVEMNFERRSTLVALGGGVVGDITGFVAAIYLRGINYIQVPTTLLAQVDSSVGGKTGVDHPLGKNIIGAFYQPKMVLIDVATLQSLPPRQIKAGLAEVVKYGVIADADFFNFLENHFDKLTALNRIEKNYTFWSEVIQRCCELKAQVVAEDERETLGKREILNYGHTIGHALETCFSYEQLIHGEGVALGMIMAARIGVELGVTPLPIAERIENLIKRLGLIPDLQLPPSDRVWAIMQKDKKVKNHQVRMIIPEKIGSVRVIEKGITAELVEKVMAINR